MMCIYSTDVLWTLAAAAAWAYFDLAPGDGGNVQGKGPSSFSGWVRKCLRIGIARFTDRFGGLGFRIDEAARPDPHF
jgi:hypothetical protein